MYLIVRMSVLLAKLSICTILTRLPTITQSTHHLDLDLQNGVWSTLALAQTLRPMGSVRSRPDPGQSRQESDYAFSSFDDTGTSHASTSQLLSENTTEIPTNSTTYYDPKPNQAISNFIINLPIHTEDEPLPPVEEMQE